MFLIDDTHSDSPDHLGQFGDHLSKPACKQKQNPVDFKYERQGSVFVCIGQANAELGKQHLQEQRPEHLRTPSGRK